MSSTTVFITLSKIPVWVWPLLVGLVAVGLMASRERTMKTRIFWFLPLIGLMTLPTLVRIGQMEIIPVFVLAYALGALFGRAYQRRVVVSGDCNTVRLRGEWVTMVTVMTLYFANFAFGTMSAVAPQIAEGRIFLYPFVTMIGFCSGSFLGRSIFVIASCHSVKQAV